MVGRSATASIDNWQPRIDTALSLSLSLDQLRGIISLMWVGVRLLTVTYDGGGAYNIQSLRGATKEGKEASKEGKEGGVGAASASPSVMD